ncbi:MAG: sigma-70 family RNA polymerase sigma factor [Pseudomonadota bacterium]
MQTMEQNEGIAAFTAALPALRGDVHRYLARMTGSVIDGEDILQDTLLAAAGALQKGAEVRNMRAWLFRIAHNTAMNAFRAQKREADMKEHLINMPPMPQPEPTQQLPEALTPYLALTPLQRSVVILRDVLGYSAAEVSNLVDTSVPAVKSALSRGRVALSEAREAATDQTTKLPEPQVQALRRYASLFNAHDFDGLRDMLSAEVRLELVSVEKRTGKAKVSGYYSKYAEQNDWLMVPGHVEGAPAILVADRNDPNGPPAYFILLDLSAKGVSAIRDFRYARYVMPDTSWQRL